jgi:hypothetical protein
MAEQTLHGSCLCKSVTYEVSTPFMRFGHCYCSRCRKATGGVRSTNSEEFCAANLRLLQLPGAACLAGRHAGDRSGRHSRRSAARQTVGARSLEQPGELG